MNGDIESTCRACRSNSNNGVSLFALADGSELEFSEMLSSCVMLDISKVDQYPKRICNSCSLQLPTVWKFIEMCKASDEYFKNYLEDQKYADSLSVKLEIKEEYECGVDHCDDSDHDEDLSPFTEPLISSRRRVKEERSGDITHSSKKNKKRKKCKKKEWSCPTCSHVSLTEGALKKHTKREHPEQAVFVCTHCGKVLKRKSDLKVHLRSHSGERPFACALCPSRFTQSGSLTLHVRRHTGETPFRCPLCPRLFSGHSTMRRHLRAHSAERPYSCERCGAAFKHVSSLRQHALVHSDERRHVCATCGRRVKSALALRNHILTHGERGFVCEHCGMKFFVKANLDKHSKMMHGLRSGVCPVCSKPSSDLQRHMHQHSEELSFSCKLCPRAFRTEGNLTYHFTMRHQNIRKYACQVDKCTRAFPKQNMLDFHFRKVHSNETPYVCDFCANGFFRKSDLSRHLNSVHPDKKH